MWAFTLGDQERRLDDDHYGAEHDRAQHYCSPNDDLGTNDNAGADHNLGTDDNAGADYNLGTDDHAGPDHNLGTDDNAGPDHNLGTDDNAGPDHDGGANYDAAPGFDDHGRADHVDQPGDHLYRASGRGGRNPGLGPSCRSGDPGDPPLHRGVDHRARRDRSWSGGRRCTVPGSLATDGREGVAPQLELTTIL